MRLLIVTQKVDKNDPILGFFHRWIIEFAKNCESVLVIGQSVAEYDFPKNVAVLSLGKEKGWPRIIQILRYRWLLFACRKQYDAAFIHMTPIWVVLGWPRWPVFRKRVYLWYEARGARWPLRLALAMVTQVFSASTHGMPLPTNKSVITGHGIDTDMFAPLQDARDAHQITTVGRITQSKRLDLILDAFGALSADYKLTIAGGAITDEDWKVLEALQRRIKPLFPRIHFESKTGDEVRQILQHTNMFLHASVTSLDKALLEAMACGCLVVSCADAAHDVLPRECVSTPEGMADRVKTLLAMPSAEQDRLRQAMRETIVQKHGLRTLIARLVKEMQ